MIILVGDIHGKFRELIKQIDRKGIKNCIMICVGDLGVGFQYTMQGEREGLERLNDSFNKRGIKFYSIRGNHDNPKFFDGRCYSNLSLLPDYSRIYNLDGDQKSWLFVGGAISIDRCVRRINETYWKNEGFTYREPLAMPADVLVTHTAPSWIGPGVEAPIVRYFVEKDPPLLQELLDERANTDKLYAKVAPKQAYMGHFHNTEVRTVNGCTARILDELEFFEHRHE